MRLFEIKNLNFWGGGTRGSALSHSGIEDRPFRPLPADTTYPTCVLLRLQPKDML